MSMNQDWQNPNQPPPKKGMSTGKIVLLVVLLGGGLLGLVCCGGVIYFGKQVSDTTSTDPVKVRAAADAIAEIDVPAELNPVVSMAIPFLMKMAMFQGTDQTSSMMLMEMAAAANMNEEQARAQMNQQAQAQGQQGNTVQIDQSTIETRDITVRGTPSKFQFARGKASGGEQEYWQVSGMFPGKGGQAILMLVLPADKYDADKITQIIETIQ